MQNIKILNKKEIKKIYELVKKQWDASINLDCAFLKNAKGKVYVVGKDISRLDLGKLRINSIGMYFGEMRNWELRLSIEGSQIVGKKAKKNVMELNEEEMKQWMRGNDLEKEGDLSGFILIKHKDDFLGCGKYREGKIVNFVGKSRRINPII